LLQTFWRGARRVDRADPLSQGGKDAKWGMSDMPVDPQIQMLPDLRAALPALRLRDEGGRGSRGNC
jgi:hypothetical protein